MADSNNPDIKTTEAASNDAEKTIGEDKVDVETVDAMEKAIEKTPSKSAGEAIDKISNKAPDTALSNSSHETIELPPEELDPPQGVRLTLEEDGIPAMKEWFEKANTGCFMIAIVLRATERGEEPPENSYARVKKLQWNLADKVKLDKGHLDLLKARSILIAIDCNRGASKAALKGYVRWLVSIKKSTDRVLLDGPFAPQKELKSFIQSGKVVVNSRADAQRLLETRNWKLIQQRLIEEAQITKKTTEAALPASAKITGELAPMSCFLIYLIEGVKCVLSEEFNFAALRTQLKLYAKFGPDCVFKVKAVQDEVKSLVDQANALKDKMTALKNNTTTFGDSSAQ